MSGAHTEMRLLVDGSKCDAHGICALVMPERISLDAWGYANVDSSVVDDARLVARARRVVRACPAKALTLVGDTRPARSPITLRRSK
ncbi:MAG: ferredoxin [Actinomycetota bacterium]|nr:ferredoxin [Actinomycetota bacterium]